MARPGALLVTVLGLLGAWTLVQADTPAEDHRARIALRETAVRARGHVYADGKGHVLVFAFEDDPRTTTPRTYGYYGDGKLMYPIEVSTDNSQRSPDGWVSTARFSLSDARNLEISVQVTKDAVVTCGKRTRTFTAVAGGMASLAKATLRPEPGFARSEYFLARDDGTTYFYIDLASAPAGNTDFNVYTGKRGAMKRQKVKDLASDGAGDVFVMTAGTLRLKMKPRTQIGARAFDRGTWTPTGKKAIELVGVPLERDLIYGDLGVYTGRRFETPCDDL